MQPVFAAQAEREYHARQAVIHQITGALGQAIPMGRAEIVAELVLCGALPQWRLNAILAEILRLGTRGLLRRPGSLFWARVSHAAAGPLVVLAAQRGRAPGWLFPLATRRPWPQWLRLTLPQIQQAHFD